MEQELFKTLQKLTEIGVALSSEKDKQKLLEKILEGAKELTYADGGTLYTITEDKKLRFEIIRTDSLEISWSRSSGQSLEKFPDIPLFDEEGTPNDKTIVAYAVNHDQTVNIKDAYEAEGFDFSGTKKFDASTGYRSKSFLTVPLKNHEQDIIGVLQLINAQDKPVGGTITPFTEEDQRLVESLASQAAVAMTNQRLIEELRHMFESLIRVMAEAIDEKSPVTGQHCKRVPIIAQMIAKAVSDVKEGPYKDTTFTEAELYELDIAALLHDCGKVTTPVHVVEKGKKLQTIVDRIDLVDAHFEILRRDYIIESLKEKLGKTDKIDNALSEKLKRLSEDRKLIHESNFGKETISEQALARIDELTKTTWEDEEGQKRPLITEDEAKNLSIARGTLTAEERQIIQNHVVMTIKMLSKIPYPKHLKEVPEIAGKHHERIDGKGYPLGLTGKDMSVRARILAVADVFEALTAPDRPYKDVMPLSQALSIMTNMSKEGHIDKDIWDVFLSKKVYLEYGKQYLKPSQLDVQ